MSNLFSLVMEANGDLLEPFTPNEDPAPSMPDQQGAGEQPPADMGADSPPSATEELDDLSFDDTGGGTEDEANPENQQGGEGAEQPGPSLAKQANDVLNQQLYQHMCDQNEAIEGLLEELQSIIPALPYDVVVQNDRQIQRLKRTLETSKNYVLYDFVGSTYGENLLKSNEFDALFIALQNEIDKVLKKHFKDSE